MNYMVKCNDRGRESESFCDEFEEDGENLNAEKMQNCKTCTRKIDFFFEEIFHECYEDKDAFKGFQFESIEWRSSFLWQRCRVHCCPN